MKETVVFDFDGVIHSYTSGWKGADVIPDPPVPGIKEAISQIRQSYRVVVVSARCASFEGVKAISLWLAKHGIEVDAVMAEKPPAKCYIDDRAICFDGNSGNLIEKIKSFQPWHKRKPMQETEQKSCLFCCEDREGYTSAFGAFYLLRDRFDGWCIHAGKCKPKPVKYCPMCGRDLTEGATDERAD